MKKIFLSLICISTLTFAENEYFWAKPENILIEQAVKNSDIESLSATLETVKLSKEEKDYYSKLAENIVNSREENLRNCNIFSHSKVNDKHLLPNVNSLVRQDYLTKLTILIASTGLIAFILQNDKNSKTKEKILDKAVYGIPVGGLCAFISSVMIFNNGLKTYRALKMLRDNSIEIKELIEAHGMPVQEIIEQ